MCRSRTARVYQQVECAIIQHIHHRPAFRRTTDGNTLDLKLAEAKPRPLVSVDEAGAPDEHLREVAVLETCRQRQPCGVAPTLHLPPVNWAQAGLRVAAASAV